MQNPLRQPTPGITTPNLTAEPLGTAGEMTPGPDELDPYESPEAAREVAAIEAEMAALERERQPDALVDTLDAPPLAPRDEPEPFAFDEVGAAIDDLRLPGLERF